MIAEERPSRVGDGGLVRVPTDELYWAELRGLPRRPSDQALRFAFECWLPGDLDGVETRFARIGGDRYLACGIDRDRLSALIGRADSSTASVLPAGAPAHLAEDRRIGRAIESLEFRSGAFADLRAVLVRRCTAAALVLGLGAALVAVLAVLSNQAAAMRAHAEDVRAAITSLVDAEIGQSGQPGLDPLLVLGAELRRLELTRTEAPAGPADRGATCLELLAAWPADLPARVESLIIEQDSIELRGALRSLADHDQLRSSLASVDGWELGSGGASRRGEVYDFTLVINPSGDRSQQ